MFAQQRPCTGGPCGHLSPSAVGDVTAEMGSDYVALVEMHRPPNNSLDVTLVEALAEVFERLDGDMDCRAIVLASEGRHFCAGASLGSPEDPLSSGAGGANNPLYEAAVRLFRIQTPIVAAIQGAAIGGGLGLALVADFRVTCAEARFSANFTRLGLHQGFGISVTLPNVVGNQVALDLLLTGRRLGGEESVRLELCDRLVAQEQVRTAARELATDIASAAPLAVRSVRETLRGSLADQVASITKREHEQQQKLSATSDYQEGVQAYAERRPARFTGR
jgi:2-(1,2-epoxy-1,2-dihydrophenyl)acetyl-CoA isomerase